MKNQVYGILAIVAIVAVVGLMSGFSGCTTQEGGDLTGEAISINRDNWDYVSGVLFPSARGLQDSIRIDSDTVNIGASDSLANLEITSNGIQLKLFNSGGQFSYFSSHAGGLTIGPHDNNLIVDGNVNSDSYCDENGDYCFMKSPFSEFPGDKWELNGVLASEGMFAIAYCDEQGENCLYHNDGVWEFEYMEGVKLGVEELVSLEVETYKITMSEEGQIKSNNYCNRDGENCFSAEEFISKQDVLDMLNSCQPTIVDEFSTDYSSSSCNTVCTDLGKTCILTNALNINLDGDTTLVNCGYQWNELQSYQIFNCVCC